MDLGLAGAVAVVVGASGGLGSATARVLFEEGCHVLLVGRSLTAIQSLADNLAGETRDRATAAAVDIQDGDMVESAISSFAASKGRLDVLVNVAGDVPMVRAADLDATAWSKAAAEKLGGYLNTCRTAARLFKGRRAGSIVNVVGNSGREPGPSATAAMVNAALLSFTKSLAQELAASGVRVNAVNPGPVQTPRLDRLLGATAATSGRTLEEAAAGLLASIPEGRFGTADEIARLIAFVASPACPYLTGTALTVDGGQTRSVTY